MYMECPRKLYPPGTTVPILVRDLSRAAELVPTVVLVGVLAVLAAVQPAMGAADSLGVIVLVPQGTYHVGDTVTVTVRVFSLGAATDPDTLTLVISGASAYRGLSYVRVGVGEFTSTFQIQQGDPAGLTYGGPTDIVSVHANATAGGLSWSGVGDLSVWPVPEALDMVLSVPQGWLPAGTTVTVNATVSALGLPVDPDTIQVWGSIDPPGSAYGPSVQIGMGRMSTGSYSGTFSIPSSTSQDSIVLITGEADLGTDFAVARSRTFSVGRPHAFTAWQHVRLITPTTTQLDIWVANETAWPVAGANVSLYYPVGSCFGSGCMTPRWIYGTTDHLGGASFTLSYPVRPLTYVPFRGNITAGGQSQTFWGLVVDPEPYGSPLDLCPSNRSVSYAPGETVQRTYHMGCGFRVANQTFFYYAHTANAMVANGSVVSDAEGGFTLTFVAPSEDVSIDFRTNLTNMGWVRYSDWVVVADPGLIHISDLSIGNVAQITVDLLNVSGTVSFVPYNATNFMNPGISEWAPLSWSPTYDVIPAVAGAPFHANLVLPRFLPKDQDYLLTVSVNHTVLNPGFVFAEVVHPTNLPPTASARFSTKNPVTGETVTVNASASNDPDGLIVLYRFLWGDGSAGDWTEASAVTHAYASPGTYTVAVIVQDDTGAEAVATFAIVAEGTVLGVRASTFYLVTLGVVAAAVTVAAVAVYLRRARSTKIRADEADRSPPPEADSKPPRDR